MTACGAIEMIVRLPPDHPEGIRRVQVGCGPHHIRPDWWNVDILSFDGIDQVMDVTQPWPWESCLEFVYGEHFLEHLSIGDAIEFLTNAGNALVPGGKIRLSTPSLEWVLTTHYRLDRLDGDKVGETFAINRAFHGWGHNFLYSKAMLNFALSNMGFEHIEFFEFGISRTEALKNLERHGAWSVAGGFPNTWIVEAERGSEASIEATGFLLEEIETKIARYVKGGH
jgi:predicted SAM-dependent methyltransferase